MKSSHKAIKEIISAITDIADIVRDLDPGRTRQYSAIVNALAQAREHLANAKVFER